MLKKLTSAVAVLILAIGLPLSVAPAASALPSSGKANISTCWNHQMNSGKTYFRTTCNPPGKQYRFEIRCSWYSAGRGGSYWKSSPWTNDGRVATATCNSGSYFTGVGRTIYWRR